MSRADFTRREDEETPLTFHLRNSDETTKDLSAGYTFAFYLIRYSDNAVVVSKTTDIEGFASDPNIVVSPEQGWWTGLSGRYMIHLKYIDGTGHDEFFRLEAAPTIEIIPPPT